MAFPTSSLTNNQVHKEGNRAFVYDSALGVWDQVRETDRTENKILSGEIGSGVTFPVGHVRQVLYDQQTASDSSTVVTSATYVPIVGLSQAITILASSKVYIHTNIHLYIQQNTANNWSTANLKIFRDSTEVHLPAGTNPYVHGRYTTDSSDRTMTFVPLSYLDTPGSAGTYTYTVKISSKNGFTVGSTPNDQMGFSNITLMEITG